MDWYPWGGEAFARAREEDKPVFLSIGYSTCHWCHVMARESFRDPGVAELINRTMIPVKVDREERPDIDDIYMTACQMLTGSGGWPLTIIMTPDRKPFFATTYIPREDRFGRPGMLTLIPRIADLWENRREELVQSAEKTITALKQQATDTPGREPGEDLLEKAYREIAGDFDSDFGGFGIAPKFPTPHKLDFLLRYWKRTGEEEALRMVEKTLQAMRGGGVFDQIGFGFHRYSTDRKWILPHFEKMLYDQATLIRIYTDTWLATGRPEYRKTVEQTIQYVLREMTSPEGGFYSAEDADSEGKEGKFYLWTREDIRRALDPREADLAEKIWNLEEEGNFRDQATGRKTGGNILYPGNSLKERAESLEIQTEELEEGLNQIRKELLAERNQRTRPHRDDKILTDWNGLMISALARAGSALENRDYIRAASGAAQFIIDNMEDGQGRLLHRYREGEAGIPGFIDDYAFMIEGLIQLYQSTFDLKYLEKALEYYRIALRHHRDNRAGGFFTTPDYQGDAIIRKKQIYDGAIPSGNSTMMTNLIKLSHLTGMAGPEEEASALGRAFYEKVRLAPSAYTALMAGVSLAAGPSYQVVITGEREREDTAELLSAIRKNYIPNMVAIFKPDSSAEEKNYLAALESLAQFTGELTSRDGRATAYVCRNFACNLPTTDPAEMLKQLSVDTG